MVFDHHVLALDVPGFVEALTERSGVARGSLARTAADECDDRHPWVLRARRDRPRRRTAEKRDELAPSHSMTSSALTSSVFGTSRPSVLAAFRLMTVSY